MSYKLILIKQYENWRALDAMMVMGATDGLTRLFGISGNAASVFRRIGMAGVQRMPSLKNWFMDEARGVAGDSPRLLQ